MFRYTQCIPKIFETPFFWTLVHHPTYHFFHGHVKAFPITPVKRSFWDLFSRVIGPCGLWASSRGCCHAHGLAGVSLSRGCRPVHGLALMSLSQGCGGHAHEFG